MIDRLQKKCVIGATMLHGSLCGVLLICSAFKSEPPPPEPLELFPFAGNIVATDGPSHGGGSPPPVAKPVKQEETPKPADPPPVVKPVVNETPPKVERDPEP